MNMLQVSGELGAELEPGEGVEEETQECSLDSAVSRNTSFRGQRLGLGTAALPQGQENTGNGIVPSFSSVIRYLFTNS